MTPASSRPGPLSAVREFSGRSVQVPHTVRQGPAGALGCWLPWRACRGRGGGEGGPRPSPRVCGQLPVAAGAHSSGVERGPQILQGCEWGRGSPQWPLMETIGTAHTHSATGSLAGRGGGREPWGHSCAARPVPTKPHGRSEHTPVGSNPSSASCKPGRAPAPPALGGELRRRLRGEEGGRAISRSCGGSRPLLGLPRQPLNREVRRGRGALTGCTASSFQGADGHGFLAESGTDPPGCFPTPGEHGGAGGGRQKAGPQARAAGGP